MPHFAVTAVGVDRPGIVAAVTAVFVEQGCNLEDTSMTILRGHFAMMMVVDAPEGVSTGDLEAALVGPAAAFDLLLAVRPLRNDTAGEAPPPESIWTVAVYGADHPGIVHGVASLLAGLEVNIVDLHTRVVGEPDSPVYSMLLEVSLPAGVRADHLGAELQRLGTELGVSVSLHPSEADIL